MVSNNYFSHIAPDGSFLILRAPKAGYTGLYGLNFTTNSYSVSYN